MGTRRQKRPHPEDLTPDGERTDRASAAVRARLRQSIQNITGCRSPCNVTAAARSAAHIDGATCLPQPIHDNETQMMAWLAKGPLSVSIAAGELGGCAQPAPSRSAPQT
eukprot:3825179-Prymnesium_polylepis.1